MNVYLLMVLFNILVLALPSFGQNPSKENNNGILEAAVARNDLYRSDANAKEEIEGAVRSVATNHKRVLLVFGGNWCYDCHVLDRALHEGAAGEIMRESFVLVHVDIGEGDKNLDLLKKYKIPLEKGVPAVALLNSKGELIYSSGEGEFEAARRMMKQQLVTFLRLWKEARPETGRGDCDVVR